MSLNMKTIDHFSPPVYLICCTCRLALKEVSNSVRGHPICFLNFLSSLIANSSTMSKFFNPGLKDMSSGANEVQLMTSPFAAKVGVHC